MHLDSDKIFIGVIEFIIFMEKSDFIPLELVLLYSK